MRLAAFSWLVAVVLGFPAWGQQPGTPGQFDYYVLSLSWSPTWCATRSGRDDTDQCAGPRSYGFVVHGLWPQYAQGGYPAQCAATETPDDGLVREMLTLMPSRKLIAHEWSRHGTCSGMAPPLYFETTRKAFAKLRLPKAFVQPRRVQTLSVAQVEKLFATANPGLDGDALAVVCRGRYGAEVRICLDRNLDFRPCGRDVRDRCRGNAMFPPQR